MNNSDKNREQLAIELSELRKQSKEQKDKLIAVNQQLDAHNQQLQASEQTLKKQTPENQTEKNVATGHLATGSPNGTICTSPLGSCVAVIAYNKTSKTGGIAHIMLPGRSPTEDKPEENKYAENAIENLLDELKKSGSKKANIEICLVGGANVLRKENDTTADNLIFSIFEIMEQKKLSIKSTSLGGYERRTAKLNLPSGIVTFTHGEKAKRSYLILFPVIQEE